MTRRLGLRWAKVNRWECSPEDDIDSRPVVCHSSDNGLIPEEAWNEHEAIMIYHFNVFFFKRKGDIFQTCNVVKAFLALTLLGITKGLYEWFYQFTRDLRRIILSGTGSFSDVLARYTWIMSLLVPVISLHLRAILLLASGQIWNSTIIRFVISFIRGILCTGKLFAFSNFP